MTLYRSWLDRDTLRQQMLKWVLVPMAILMLLNIALFYKFGYDSANRRHDRTLNEISKVLLDQLRTEHNVTSFKLHTGALSLLTDDKKDLTFYSLRGVRQQFQFGSPDLPLLEEKLSTTPRYYFAQYAGRSVRVMAAILPEADVPDGQVVVIIAKTLVLHRERAQEWMWRVLPAQFVLIVFAGLMVWWGVGRGLRPLLHMRDEVVARSPQDLSPFDEGKVVAEVRPLIHGFNQLLGRLRESTALQQRFIADAAHQLRTPLAGLKVQTELAMRTSNPEELHHTLSQMHTAMAQTVHLAQQLLALARAEPGAQGQSSMQSFDFAMLVKNITANWVQTALQKNIDLGFEGETEAKNLMLGNRFLLTEMLNNLIDNALRYTPRDGQVTVRLLREASTLLLEVEDNGIGIPEHLRKRVFERFYRVLGSDQPGCGLGLAIVWEIVSYHAGQVTILDGAQGRGTLFRIRFPIMQKGKP